MSESTRSRKARSFARSEEHTSELQSPCNLVCRLLLEKKKISHNRGAHQHKTHECAYPGRSGGSMHRIGSDLQVPSFSAGCIAEPQPRPGHRLRARRVE